MGQIWKTQTTTGSDTMWEGGGNGGGSVGVEGAAKGEPLTAS